MTKSKKETNLKLVKGSKNDSSKVSALSPREIVSELDRYVIGQKEAKKALKVASDICVFTNNNVTMEKI